MKGEKMKHIILVLVVLMVPAFIHCGEEKKQNIRKAVLAGQWYPGDKTGLAKTVDDYLSNVKTGNDERKLLALISPHAGYVYSGQTAAYAYKLLEGREIERVIVLALSHRVGYDGISVSDADFFETPLGRIPVDRAACDGLLKKKGFVTVGDVEKAEHSLEIQLPFLQKTAGDFRLVPLVVGRIGENEIERYAEAIREYVNEKTIIIASSDFTHYGRDFAYVPFRDNIESNLEKLDMGAFETIKSMDANSFLDYRNRTGATICGFQPIAILMKILPEDTAVELLRYDTSGNITGDFETSVSYMSIGFFQKENGKKETGKMTQDKQEGKVLTKKEQDFLLRLARKTIEHIVNDGEVPDSIIVSKAELTPALQELSGVFVTLHKHGQLRGCIGYIEGIEPLYKAVIDNAVSASTGDPRFRPVSAAELKDLHIEISVMTPLKEVSGYKDIVIGKHGVVLMKGGRQSVFLPQVAPEQGWDRDETLTHLSMKAGLPGDAWKEGCGFKVFEAQIFEEED